MSVRLIVFVSVILAGKGKGKDWREETNGVKISDERYFGGILLNQEHSRNRRHITRPVKKKRRKGYKVRNGHRQAITEIEISDILTGVSKKTTAKKAESKKTEAPKKAQAKKASAKKESQDFSSMSVAELKTLAKDKGITGISSMKKADLIKALS